MRITSFHRFIKKLIEKQTYQKYLTISFLNIYYFCHPWCMIYRSSRVMNLYSKRVWKKTKQKKKHCIWRGFNVAAPATKKSLRAWCYACRSKQSKTSGDEELLPANNSWKGEEQCLFHLQCFMRILCFESKANRKLVVTSSASTQMKKIIIVC